MQYFQLISSETGTISSGTLNIYNGDTVSGTPIYTQSYPQLIILAAGAPITFNITGTAPLVLNNQYTFVFTVDNVDFKYDITAMYPDGETWQDGFPVPNVDLIFTVLINNNLGINEYNQLKKIKIYPNPSNAFIKISNLTSVEKYSIYNLLGEKIIVDSISNDEKIDIQDLANGIYFLKFENGNTLKFLKE